jgi:ATP-dependent helicase/DNAse subunit B
VWERPPASLTAPAALADLRSIPHFSPSALESYLNCPFVWFVERLIGAEDIDCELDRRLVGQMLHSVLSTTYQQLDSCGLLPVGADRLEAVTRVADEVIERSVSGEEYPGSLAERRLAACQLKRMTRNLFEMEAEAESALQLLHSEMWVGGRQGTDVGGLRVLGRIDRVDRTPEGGGLFIFDYKSGSIPSGSDLGSESALQLPLYALAVMNEYPQSEVLGGAYLALNEKRLTGFVVAGAEHHLGRGTNGYRALDEAGMDELFANTKEVARAAAEAMLAGEIAPRPDRRCPSWCRLGPACRMQRRGYRL